MRLLIVGAATPGSPRAARPELDPGADVQLILADDYPNFSICGIPSVAKTALLVGPAPAGPAAPPDPRALALQVGVGDRRGLVTLRRAAQPPKVFF